MFNFNTWIIVLGAILVADIVSIICDTIKAIKEIKENNKK